MSTAFDPCKTRLLAQLHASERRWTMERDGVDYIGEAPCWPPVALAKIVARVLLRARVAADDADEVLPSRLSYEELAREQADECRADRAAGVEWGNL